MGQFSKRTDEQRITTSVAGSQVWLESCTECHRPMTVLSPTKPENPRCAECGPAAVAD